MSIDMKSFMGEYAVQTESTPIVPQGPAATVPQEDKTNSYQAQDEYPMPAIPAEQPASEAIAPPEVVAEAKEDPQERNFRALAAEVERIKSEKETERREFQLQLEMMRANKPTQESTKPRKMFDDMQDNDVPNVGEIRKAWEQRESEYQARIEELQVASRFSDYAEVVEKFAAPLVNEKPHLIQGILNSQNKAQALYELGKMAQQLKSTSAPVQSTPKSVIAQKIVENARRPGTLAQAGGQSVLSKADYFASMSDAEFMKVASQNLEGI